MGDDNRRLALFVAVTVVVVASSLAPAPTGPGGAPTGDVAPPGSDLVVHAIGYAAVAYTLAAVLPARFRRTDSALPLVGVVVATAALGGAVELAQSFVPGRTLSTLDAVANAVGATVGVVWWRVRERDE